MEAVAIEVFEQQLKAALSDARELLRGGGGTAPRVELAANVPHAYSDKFAVAEGVVRAGVAAVANSLTALGMTPEALATLKAWQRDGQRVTLRLDAAETCGFVKKTTSTEVVGPTRETTVTTTGVTGFLRKLVSQTRTVTKYHWAFKSEWTLFAYAGAACGGDDPRVVLDTRTGEAEIVRAVESLPVDTHDRVPVELDITWWLNALDEERADTAAPGAPAVTVAFAIDRSANTTATPRRNEAVDRAVRFFLGAISFAEKVRRYFEEWLWPLCTEATAKLDAGAAWRAGGMVFAPVLPVLCGGRGGGESEADGDDGDDEVSDEQDSDGGAVVPNASTAAGSAADGPHWLPPAHLNRLLHEEARALSAGIAGMSKSFPQSSTHPPPPSLAGPGAGGGGGGDSATTTPASTALVPPTSSTPPAATLSFHSVPSDGLLVGAAGVDVGADGDPHSSTPLDLGRMGSQRSLASAASEHEGVGGGVAAAKTKGMAALKSLEHGLATVVEARLLVVWSHISRVALACIQGVNYTEGMLRQQLVAAIGTVVGPAEFQAYMTHHARRLFAPAYAPREFMYPVRVCGKDPEGFVSINARAADGGGVAPVQTVVRQLRANAIGRGGGSRYALPEGTPVVKFAITAASEATVACDQYVHCLLRHEFNSPSAYTAKKRGDAVGVAAAAAGAEEYLNDDVGEPLAPELDTARRERSQAAPAPELFLEAKANMFAGYILVLGAMGGDELFLPKHAFVVRDEELLKIPLAADTIPPPKEFADIIASLSEEQQRFCRAFRAMQLEASLFAVLAIPIKPQVERALNLPAGALDKELALTQTVLQLMTEYSVPAEMLEYTHPHAQARNQALLGGGAPLGVDVDNGDDDWEDVAPVPPVAGGSVADPPAAAGAVSRTAALTAVKAAAARVQQTIDTAKEAELAVIRAAEKEARRLREEERRRKAEEKKREKEAQQRDQQENLWRITRSLAEVTETMHYNIDSVLERSERLCSIEQQAASLETCAATFRKSSKRSARGGVLSGVVRGIKSAAASAAAATSSSSASAPPPQPAPAAAAAASAPGAGPAEQGTRPPGSEIVAASPAAEGAAAGESTAEDPVARSEPDADGGERGKRSPLDAGAGGHGDRGFCISKLPDVLEAQYTALDVDNAIRPTILKVADEGPWESSKRASIIAPVTTSTLGKGQKETRRRDAFDLLDAITRSGAVPIACAALHVVVASTHCFGSSVMDTLVQANVNPVERVERSLLIAATAVHERPAHAVLEAGEVARVLTHSPQLAIDDGAYA